MSTGLDIVALGEPLIKFNQQRHDEPTYLQGFGGNTSNMAIAAVRLGARADYITRIGDDAFGRMFLALRRRENVRRVRGKPFIARGLPLDIVRNARIFHVSAITQAISPSACHASFAAMDAARSSGVKVSYDTNLRLTSGDDDAIVTQCHEAGAPIVVLKRGARGCIVSDGAKRETLEGHRVDVVDATGAGDCFDRAFAARIVAGDDPFTAAA